MLCAFILPYSGLSEHSVPAGPPFLMLLSSAQYLSLVQLLMLSGNLSSLSRLTFSCQCCAVQTKPADTLSWGCSFTAVLTEATICLARRGCLLWVMPLQLVSATAFSNCHGANHGKKMYSLQEMSVSMGPLIVHQSPVIFVKLVFISLNNFEIKIRMKNEERRMTESHVNSAWNLLLQPRG